MRRASIGAIARTQDRALAWKSRVCHFCSWVTLAEGDLTDVDTEILYPLMTDRSHPTDATHLEQMPAWLNRLTRHSLNIGSNVLLECS